MSLCGAESTLISDSCKNKLSKHTVSVSWLSFGKYSNTYKKSDLSCSPPISYYYDLFCFIPSDNKQNLSTDFVQMWDS